METPEPEADIVMPDGAAAADRPVSRKRKAGTQPVVQMQEKKARSDEGDRLVLLYVNGLPTTKPRQASALVVGFNGQQLAQVLYDILYGNSSVDALDEDVVKARIQGFLDGAVELSHFKKKTYVVTDGPPSISTPPSSASSPPPDQSADARVRKRPLRVFVAKKFPSGSLYPEVAVLVDETEEQAAKALRALTEGVIDNRPASVKARGADICEVTLTAPGFYRLSDGEFYDC